ncbi:MAG: hypothetical protein ACK4S6_00595 [Roseateles asaccharophilus]|uniref:hypothetical protein n=1 Tax=Roseateles asaccharophilus TaxID=582607 RepID=UPI00391BEEAE
MKLIGFWLLCLVAVLVPVSASIATSMICPEAFVSKAQARQPKADDVGHRQTLASAAGKHGSKALASAKKVSEKAADSSSQSSEPCCDFSPCSHCISCSASASMIALDAAAAEQLAGADTRIAGSAAPRAEFLLSGQDRPPRST